MLRHLIQAEKAKPVDEDKMVAMSYRKNLKVMDYDHLKPGTKIETLLPGKTSGVILFFLDHREKSEIGHWVLLFRSPEAGVVFFEPLGLGYRSLLKFTKNANKLQQILSRTDAYVSKQAYQRREHVQTCGRHCITRWNCAHLNHKEYSALMHDPRLSADEVVVMLTLSRDLTELKKR